MNYVYMYEHRKSGKVYIGKTIDIERRKYEHSMRPAKNSLLDRAIKKHGIAEFDFYVLAIFDTNEQASREEMYWIARMREVLGHKKVYNRTDGGEGISGWQHSDTSKKKMSASQKEHFAMGGVKPMLGKRHSQETKNRISEARIGKYAGENSPMFGKHISEERKQHLSEINTGKKHSETTKQKMSEDRSGEKNAMFGRKHSDDTKRLIAESKKNPSDESRQRMSEGQKKKAPISKETRQKMSDARKGDRNCNFGKPMSEKTKKKMAETKRVRHEAKKALANGKAK